MSNNLSKKPSFSVAINTASFQKAINNTLRDPERARRFTASIVSAVSNNSDLEECDAKTIITAALLGESLNLSPSPQLGQYYLVPYYSSKDKCKVAQFQMGYKGYIQLAVRSGYYRKLNVLAIKEGELIRFDPLEEEIEVRLIEDEIERENAETIGYYAMFEYHNGFHKAIYWSKKKMLEHANKFSQAFSKDAKKKKVKNEWKQLVSFEDYEAGKYPKEDEWLYSSFWYKHFDVMAYKTMLRQLISKWGIMSIEMQDIIAKDMAVLREDGSAEYVDMKENILDQNEPDEVEDIKVAENTEPLSFNEIDLDEVEDEPLPFEEI